MNPQLSIFDQPDLRRHHFNHKHGHKSGAGTRTYTTWFSMKQRCLYVGHKSYAFYGGRGIKICERWLDFTHFLADMGERPEGKSLDRIDNTGNYEPANCRWATAKEQAWNRRNNRWIEFGGIRRTVQDWESSLGLSHGAMAHRLRLGWPISLALTIPKARQWRKRSDPHSEVA